MPEEKETTLAVIDKYAIAKMGKEDLAEVLRENLDDELSPLDLPSLPFPTGGSLYFDSDWFDEPMKKVTGIVIMKKKNRAYWENSDELGNPPECFANDGKTGKGTPGGDCSTCPLSQFGPDNERPGCKERMALFVIVPDMLLPVVIMVPPTSLKSAKKYFIGLASKGQTYWKVETEINLEKATNAQKIDYAKAVFKPGKSLSKENAEMIESYRKSIAPALETFSPPPPETNENDVE